MKQEIEIKRKVFEVIEDLGERSKKVTRKGKYYFLKDFASRSEEFSQYVDNSKKLENSGVRAPKIYIFDKNKHIIVEEFIDGDTVLDTLIKEDLPEVYIEQIYLMNWYMKKDKFAIDFDPANFKFDNGKLFYIGNKIKKYDEKYSFQKMGVWYWFYTKDFVDYLKAHKLPIDSKRSNVDQGVLNKQIALLTVKYYH